jgi:outer membrane protein OmpA-like peptidoglycan-associated protein
VIVRAIILAVLLGVPTVLTATWIKSADARITEAQAQPAAGSGGEAEVPVAAQSDVAYCNPELKRILRRVLMSCGLVGNNAVRGCQPVQAKNVATMSGHDFNALFRPMKDRGSIVQFDKDKSDLDATDLAMIDQTFADQRGASWFFVVARASPEGSVEHNRELSKARAEAVMGHLREQFKDPDLDKEVGMLWLGGEYAQLEKEFCDWKRSSPGSCTLDQLNRSAFVAWIDCQL